MKFKYLDRVTIKSHPSLHSFYGEDAEYEVVNFRAIADGQRFYMVQPVVGVAKYKVAESNLVLVNDNTQ